MNNYEFIRNDLEDTYGVLKLQNKILEIMVYIDKFCTEHNIKYYLMGGSALGAMRHGGFIPWDDDLDIFMDRANYLKFIECCKTDLNKEKYYLQVEDSSEHPHYFSKLRMNGTTCIEAVNKNNKKKHQGIFVDIMCLNNSAKSKFGKKVQYYAAGLLKAKAISKTAYETDSKKKKIEIFIAKCVVWGPFKKLLLHLVRRYNKKPTEEVTHLFGRAKFKNSFYKTELFGEGRRVPFEKVQLVAPQGVEEYLTLRYGPNYMEMPSEETKAIYATHAMVWDTERDYREYFENEED
ncbi:MAG: LicD family protein [Clostridia bacterium]|nr:LicD family protein [Clostridia bacterium]